MMGDKVIEKVVSKFWEKVSDMSWDDWCNMSSKDKEEIVPEVFSELDDITLDIDEVYDLFWEWESGLEESSFVEFN